MRSIFIAFICVAFYCAIPARAGLIFDQSPPNTNGYALDMTDFRVADDFTLATPSSVDAINFWYFGQFQTDLSNVTYGFYRNSGGSLGTLLFTGTVAPNTSFDALNNAFFAVVPLPNLLLGPGAYWLELHAGTSFTDTNGTLEIDWANANDNATAQALSNNSGALPNTRETTSGFEQLAFQLDGAAVPEPSTSLLAGPMLVALMAAAALGVRQRKRRAGATMARQAARLRNVI